MADEILVPLKRPVDAEMQLACADFPSEIGRRMDNDVNAHGRRLFGQASQGFDNAAVGIAEAIIRYSDDEIACQHVAGTVEVIPYLVQHIASRHGGGQNRQPEIGQLEACRTAKAQASAEPVFERLHVPADRRAFHVQAQLSGGQAATLRDDAKDPHQP